MDIVSRCREAAERLVREAEAREPREIHCEGVVPFGPREGDQYWVPLVGMGHGEFVVRDLRKWVAEEIERVVRQLLFEARPDSVLTEAQEYRRGMVDKHLSEDMARVPLSPLAETLMVEAYGDVKALSEEVDSLRLVIARLLEDRETGHYDRGLEVGRAELANFKKEALAFLRRIEWAARGSRCPDCGNSVVTRRHTTNCKLAAMISGIEGPKLDGGTDAGE